MEITLVAPDLDYFSEIDPPLPYGIRKVIDPGDISTRLLRRVRSLFAYFYWSLLDVQSEFVLGKMSESFVLASLGVLGKVIKPQSILRVAHALRFLRLNKYIAKVGLGLLRILEFMYPVDKKITAQIKDIDPDIILATPAIQGRSFDMDYVRTGKKLGIPVATLIASWDNLTTMGLISVIPDRVLVWNDQQIQEAHQYHLVPRDRIIAVGAPVFDRLFEEHMLQSRFDFCKHANLDAERPFVLWAASSSVGSDDETVIARRFIEEMQFNPMLKDFQVLIRPHPKAFGVWKNWNVEDAPVWSNPVFINNEDALMDIYNTLNHAVAVVGLSTSLFIETAVLDRPCALLLSSEADKDAPYNKLIHFNYWLSNNFPVATKNEADCARWLAQIVEGRDDGREARRLFVNSFVRPKGIDRSAADVAAEAILELAKEMD